MANSADPDKLASSEANDLDLHCLQNRVYPGSAGQGLMYLHIYYLGHYHYQGWEYAGVDIDEEEEDMENDAEEEEEQEAEGEVNQVSTLTFTILWANSADNK